MSSISPFKTANILPPTIPPTGPSLSSESEDEGEKEKVNQPIAGEVSRNQIHAHMTSQSGKVKVLYEIIQLLSGKNLILATYISNIFNGRGFSWK